MVNFRFHLVSLTAVFFALALGVVVGATVLERTTVETLESQVSRVEARLDETDALNEQLRRELELRDQFAEQVGDRLLQGRLEGVPVVLFTVSGIDRTPVDALRGSLNAAGARIDATVTFTAKLALAEDDDVVELADLLESTATRPAPLRRHLFSALSTSWTTGTAHDFLLALQQAGFVEYQRAEPPAQVDPPADGVGGDEEQPPPRFLLVSGSAADVGNEDLAVPLTEEMAEGGERLVLAAESGDHVDDGAFRAPFVTELRARESVVGVISTIDNVGTYLGRTAAVLAVEEMGSGRLGHYGRAEGAEALVPPPPPA